MAKFSGEVGYVGETQETSPGVWEEVVTEQTYFGDIIRNIGQLTPGEQLNPEVTINNSISIVANEYAIEHFHEIRYVRWAGGLWTITSVEVRIPRLILSMGSVWNGPTPSTP